MRWEPSTQCLFNNSPLFILVPLAVALISMVPGYLCARFVNGGTPEGGGGGRDKVFVCSA